MRGGSRFLLRSSINIGGERGHRIPTLLARLSSDNRGVVAVIVAFAATVLIGFTALGVETGLWYAIERQNQSAADAAALAGAYELAEYQGSSGQYSDICNQVQKSATANGFTFSNSFSCPSSSPGCTSPSSGQMCANNPPVGSTSNNSNTSAVEVYLAQQQKSSLANLFLSSVTITTHAVALVNKTGITCDLSLGTTGTDVSIQGSATINLTNCGIATNSSSSSSISFGGGNNDILNASWFQTVGNYSSSGSPQITVPTELTNAAPVTDPYSCNPPAIGCAGKITYSMPSSPVNSSSPCLSVTSNTTVTPGLYGDSSNGSKACSNDKSNASPPMSFTGGTATLCPGVYYLDGEDKAGEAFVVGSSATVQMGTAGSSGCPSNGMTGVTIIASSQNGKLGGGFNITGTVTLSTPTAAYPSGCTVGSSNPCMPSGLLFYQDPTYADTSTHGNGLTADSTLTANGTTALTGTLYTPKTNITFTGNANSTCFIVIALTVTYTGNSTMAGSQSACSAVGVSAPTVLNVALTQ